MAQSVKNIPAMQEDAGLILGSGRSPRGVNATHSSMLAWRIPMDRGAWWAIVQKVTKSQIQLSD